MSELLRSLSQYIDVSSEMQVGTLEFACPRGGVIRIKQLCDALGLQYKQALDLMVRLRRRGLVERKEPGVYLLTEKGLEACRIIRRITSSGGVSLKAIKLLLILGTSLRGGMSPESLEKASGLSIEESLKILSGLVRIKETDGRKLVVFSETGERVFKELANTFGMGPTSLRVLAAFTKSHEPSTALLRFLFLHIGVSILVIYEVFAAPTLGAIAALTWISVTLLIAGLLALRR